MDCASSENPPMDIAKIIASNLTAWMAATPGLDTLQKLEAKSGAGFGTVRRAKKGEGNITVEKLAMIAAAFGRDPADLLKKPSPADAELPSPLRSYLLPSPNMQEARRVAESPSVYGWPFEFVDRDAYESLPPQGRVFVQGAMKAAIDNATAQFGTETRKRSA